MPRVLEAPAANPDLNLSQVQDELLGLLQRAGQPPAPPKVERRAPETSPADAAPERGKQPVSAKAAAAKAAGGQSEAAAAATAETVDPDVTCVKCGNRESWKGSSWCPQCGYYPTLNHEGAAPLEEADGIENLTLADLCPVWAVQTVVGAAVIVVLSVVLERALGGNIGLLSLASLVQLSFGLVLMLLAHKQAIMSGLQDPGCPGVLSLIGYPPAVWMPVIKHIRQRANLLVTLVWGIAASASALGIYGPIHMEEIKKEIAERRKEPKKPLMGKMLGTMTKLAVAGSQASNGGVGPGLPPGANGSLEDAIGGFAGLATEQGGLGDIASGVAGGSGTAGNLGDLAGGSGAGIDGAIGGFANLAVGQAGLDDPAKVGAAGNAGGNGKTGGGTGTAASGTPRSTASATGGQTGSSAPALPATPPLTQAIVFGYLTNAGGDIRTLLIARSGPDGRPRFAGKLSSDSLSASQWASLVAELPELRTQRPLVACPNAGQWVEPRFVLSLKADRWTSTGPVDAQVQSVERR